MDYLPNVYNLVQVSTDLSDKDYYSCTYQPLLSILANKTPPSDQWIESIQPEIKSSILPEIKVHTLYHYSTYIQIEQIKYCVHTINRWQSLEVEVLVNQHW